MLDVLSILSSLTGAVGGTLEFFAAPWNWLSMIADAIIAIVEGATSLFGL